jgi:hypothetical protein
MKCLNTSSEKHEAPQPFFRKKSAFFSEEIMRGFIFFCRNNEALGRVASIIPLMKLFLQ